MRGYSSLRFLACLVFASFGAPRCAFNLGGVDAASEVSSYEEFPKDPRSTYEQRVTECRVMIATPCFGGAVTDAFHLSVVKAYEHFAGKNGGNSISLTSATVPGIADLPKARGALVATFLKDPSMTHLLFVDADIKFEPRLIRRFVDSGHDVVAGMYPKKHVNWEAMTTYVRETLATEDSAAQTRKSNPSNPRWFDFPFEFLHETDPTKGHEVGEMPVDGNGFAEIKRAPGGFLMVTRKALVAMVTAYPTLGYEDPASGTTHWGFFHPTFGETLGENSGNSEKGEKEKKRYYLSEDFSFCDRWRDVLGNTGVWVDTETWVDHVLSPSVSFSGERWIEKFTQKGRGGGKEEGRREGASVHERAEL